MKFIFIGWMATGTHDKVWSVLELTRYNNKWGNFVGDYVVCWGRRGKKMQHKVYTQVPYYSILEMITNKRKKGYREVAVRELDTVYPAFQTDLEMLGFWAKLKT